ncbi:hypothetical protein D3C72_2123330 [compost metagenome]
MAAVRGKDGHPADLGALLIQHDEARGADRHAVHAGQDVPGDAVVVVDLERGIDSLLFDEDAHADVEGFLELRVGSGEHVEREVGHG